MQRSYKEFCAALWRNLTSSQGYELQEENPETFTNIRKYWLPFLKLQLQRLVLGGIRYGKIKDKNKLSWDRISSIETRLQHYKETGNDEILVDIGNIVFLECVEGTHPKKHFASVDDGEHAKEKI